MGTSASSVKRFRENGMKRCQKEEKDHCPTDDNEYNYYEHRVRCNLTQCYEYSTGIKDVPKKDERTKKRTYQKKDVPKKDHRVVGNMQMHNYYEDDDSEWSLEDNYE